MHMHRDIPSVLTKSAYVGTKMKATKSEVTESIGYASTGRIRNVFWFVHYPDVQLAKTALTIEVLQHGDLVVGEIEVLEVHERLEAFDLHDCVVRQVEILQLDEGCEA